MKAIVFCVHAITAASVCRVRRSAWNKAALLRMQLKSADLFDANPAMSPAETESHSAEQSPRVDFYALFASRHNRKRAKCQFPKDLI